MNTQAQTSGHSGAWITFTYASFVASVAMDQVAETSEHGRVERVAAADARAHARRDVWAGHAANEGRRAAGRAGHRDCDADPRLAAVFLAARGSIPGSSKTDGEVTIVTGWPSRGPLIPFFAAVPPPGPVVSLRPAEILPSCGAAYMT